MIYKKLLINITASGAWTQLKEELTDAVYEVGAGVQAQIGNWSAKNFSETDDVQVELAIYDAGGSVADKNRVATFGVLEPGDEGGDDDARDLIHEGYALFAKATGTSPNVTVRATIKEVTS